MTAPTTARPKLPVGLRWSDVWRDEHGNLIEGDREVPIDAKTRAIAARLLLCPATDCTSAEWSPFEFNARGELLPVEPSHCRKHGHELVEVPADGSDPNPVLSAKAKLTARVRQVVSDRKQRAVGAAKAKAEALQQAAAEAARQTSRDMRGHVPSLVATGAAMGGSVALAVAFSAVATTAIGVALSTAGVLAAYLMVYGLEWLRARRDGAELVGRAARKAQVKARRIAAGVLATGVWTVVGAVVGGDPTTLSGAIRDGAVLLLGAVLAWAVNRAHWDELWEARRRLAELARLKAEEAARRAAEEAVRLEEEGPAPAAPVAVEETPEIVGRRMAETWARVARSSTVPSGFLMSRTWIVAEETREVTAPIDGEIVHIGYEFAIESEPGALVARLGSMQPPLTAAREWLAAMLGQDSTTVELVDRPDGRVNRGLLLLTDGAPLGGKVEWKGPDGIRRTPDGTIYGHAGRTIKGDDVEKVLYMPGQPGGGGRYGHTGGGKSVGTRLTLLNDLAGGIFTTLYDPKNFVDFSEFIGVIPMGCTKEHRDVLLRSLWAEMGRRQKSLTRITGEDRHRRQRPLEGAWRIERDGPPIRSVWEEFHMEAKDQQYIAQLTSLVRLQRATASMVEVATQGGGLVDMGDSVLRGLLNSTCMELYRMPDSQARLAGYNGTFPPSLLARIPGMLLMVAGEGTPAIPMRTAFVTREDVDGSVFDYLFAPDMTPLLTAPALPKETVEVFEREGLMDLWRLGQGPDGMSKLLDDNDAFMPPMSVTESAAGSTLKLPAADVVLAIVSLNPGCQRQTVDNHEVWLRPAAGGKAPDPSTISRAAKKLDDEKLVTRMSGEYRLTDRGAERAKAALSALGLDVAAGQPLSAAEVEAQAERDVEARDEAEV